MSKSPGVPDEKLKINTFGEKELIQNDSLKVIEPDEKGKEPLEDSEWEESPPPQYESVFEQFKDRREKESKSKSIAKKICHILTGTVSTALLLILLLSLPVAMVIIGAKYKNKCPVEPFIPIYLIVGGSFGIVKTLFSLCQRATIGDMSYVENPNEDQQPIIGRLIDNILNLFLFIWFIAGNIWVYSNYKPNSIAPVRQPNNYCDPTLYLFAFWVITTSYILMAVILFCICCLGFCASCTAYFITNAA